MFDVEYRESAIGALIVPSAGDLPERAAEASSRSVARQVGSHTGGVKARLLDDLAAIDVVLALVRHRTQDMQIPAFDTHLAMAGDQLVKAGPTRLGLAPPTRRYASVSMVAVEVAGMGVVAFGCAYASAVFLDLPRWVSVLAVVAGQFVLSYAVLPLSRRLDARLLSSTPPGWPAAQVVPHDMVGEDVDVLLARARTMVGQLAGSAPSPGGDPGHVGSSGTVGRCL